METHVGEERRLEVGDLENLGEVGRCFLIISGSCPCSCSLVVSSRHQHSVRTWLISLSLRVRGDERALADPASVIYSMSMGGLDSEHSSISTSDIYPR